MSKVYISSLDSAFAKALSKLFAEQDFEIVTEPVDGIEYFIDVTDAYIEGDDKKVGEGINMAAAAMAYRKNICEPIANLEKALPAMVGKKRICFLNSVKASINYSEETSGFGHNMSKAALNLILVLTKNGLIRDGFTFRLFDPLDGKVSPENAAKVALGYFMRDRFFDDPADGIGRNDELNLIVRDALGREIPW